MVKKRRFDMKKYQALTKYVALLEKNKDYGKWILPEKREEGEPFVPYVDAYVRYTDTVIDLMCEIAHFRAEPGAVKNAFKENAIEYTENNLKTFDVTQATPELIISFLQKVVKNERFRDGAVLDALQEGYMINWLKELAAFDE